MTPPRVLPPGHFVGDGHNHGRDAGNHTRGHDHAHESPEHHLRHMQQHQRAQGRATLQEFQRAAQETRALTSGHAAENPRAQQGAAQARPAPKGESSGPRQGPGAESRAPSARSETSRQPAENARAGGREVGAWARLFSSANLAASPKAASAWAEASRQQAALPRSGDPTMHGRRAGGETGAPSRPLAGTPSARPEAEPAASRAPQVLAEGKAGRESAPLLQGLAKLQAALQATARGGTPPLALPPEAAQALGLLLQRALAAPDFLSHLPPALRALVQNMMGRAGQLLPQLFPKMSAVGLGPALPAGLGRSLPGVFSGSARIGGEGPLRGLGMLLGAPLFAAGSASKPPPNLLQRLEKALLQFFHILTAKPGTRPAKETVGADKALLEQLAALVAAEEKRRKERERAKKKEEIPLALRARRDSEFSDSEDEPELWTTERLLSHGY